MAKKQYTQQWVTRLNNAESVIMHNLREYLFKNKLIDSDTKYGLMKYCALSTLFEFADEVIPDFVYDADDLLELIEKHDSLKTKFEHRLKLLQEVKSEREEKIQEDAELEGITE